MTKRTHNEARLTGFVGDYIRLPVNEGDPCRFDIMTSDRFTTLEGEIISVHDWHTIVTTDIDFMRESVETGALVRVVGRISCRRVREGDRAVEIMARELELIEGAGGRPKRRRNGR